MDYESLIERLKVHDGIFYSIPTGKNLIAEVTTTLSMLQAENEKLRAEPEEVKRVLAMMWYAYENKDREAPHEYEIEARRAADKVLGPWAECMPKYLRNSQESSLCDTCAHLFDEVCKGCSDGDRYEPKAPADPAQAMDEITEFTRDQWDWPMGRFTRKED